MWVCGTSTVSLDRLDVAGAAPGDVLTYDGVEATWSDVVAAGGCGLSVVSERVAELTCGATTVRVRTPGEYIAAAGSQGRVRLRADGTISLTGIDLLPPPSGTYVALSRGDNSYYCGIAGSGAIDCQGMTWAGYLSPPGGSYVDVACYDTSFCCGVQSGGTVTCWDLSGGGTPPTPSGTGFVQVVATSLGACGRTGAGTVTCWNRPGGADLAGNTPTLTGVVQITDGRNDAGFTALTSAGVAEHWTETSAISWSGVPAGSYVSSGPSLAYGVFLQADGTAVGLLPAGEVRVLDGSYSYAGRQFLVRNDGTLAAEGGGSEPSD